MREAKRGTRQRGATMEKWQEKRTRATDFRTDRVSSPSLWTLADYAPPRPPHRTPARNSCDHDSAQVKPTSLPMKLIDGFAPTEAVKGASNVRTATRPKRGLLVGRLAARGKSGDPTGGDAGSGRHGRHQRAAEADKHRNDRGRIPPGYSHDATMAMPLLGTGEVKYAACRRGDAGHDSGGMGANGSDLPYTASRRKPRLGTL